MLPINLILRF